MLWAKPHSTWAWKLVPLDSRRTRLITRLKDRYEWRSSPGNALLTLILFEFGDFPMMRKLLLGVKRRAERLAASEPARRCIPPTRSPRGRRDGRDLLSAHDSSPRSPCVRRAGDCSFAGAVVLIVVRGIPPGGRRSPSPSGPTSRLYGDRSGLARGQLHPRAVPLYNALHRFWGPLALAVVVLAAALPLGYVVAALAWAGHIAFDRAIGLRPRTADGFQRGDKRMTDVLEV